MKMKKTVKSLISMLLAAVLLISMFAMAGCGKDAGSTPTEAAPQAPAQNTDAPATEASAPVVQQAFVGGWPYQTPPTGHFNMFVANSIELKFYRELQQLPLATYTAAENTYDPMLATQWSISEDGSKMTVTLRDDAAWQTGEAFTAKDVWTTFMLYRLMNNPVWSYIDGVTVVSDYEVEFTVKTATSLLNRYVLRKPIVDTRTYGAYAEKVAALLEAGKTESSDEWIALVAEFNDFRPEFINATGPYYMDPANISESAITLVKNENSFLADVVNFSEVIVYNGDVDALTPLVLNGEVDFLSHQFPTGSMETFEAMGYQTLQVAGVDGIALYFNEAVKPLDNVAVRQALAYIIDRERVGELALPGVSRGTKYITGLGDAMSESWVDTSKLVDYTVNTAKAEELLLSAGLTKNGDGKWCKEDGKPFTLELQCPTGWSDATNAATEIAQELTAFGITTTIDGIDSTMRMENITSGNYQIACSFFGTGQPHPMFAYETPLLASNADVAKGLSYNMVQTTEVCGEVDLRSLITASTAGWDEDAQKDAINKIALTVNETVPYLPLYTKWSKYVTSRDFRTDWGDNEALYQNSTGDDSYVIIKLLTGELKPIG